MRPELESVAVLADRLQADGDVRGELLALELAAALAPAIAESRRLCSEAARLRRRVPHVAWPRALRAEHGLLRGGLLVAGTWSPRQAPSLPATLDPSCRALVVPFEHGGLGLRSLLGSKLRLDGLWDGHRAAFGMRGHAFELDLDPEQTVPLLALGIRRPLRNPAALRQLDGLEQLHCGSYVPLEGELLASLPALGLRSLSGGVQSIEQLRAVLDACQQLEELELLSFQGTLEPMPGLERLRTLALVSAHSGGQLGDGLSLPRLESLCVSNIDRADVDRIAAFPQLRRLTVLNPRRDHDAIIEAVARLGELEHLVLQWPGNMSSNPAPLAKLAQLRTLTLVGGLSGELDPPASLESLRLDWSAAHNVRVRRAIAAIRSDDTFAQLQANVELRGTKLLHLSRVRPQVELLQRSLTELETLETLVINDARAAPHELEWLGDHPGLRTLWWPHLTIDQQRELGQRLPHLQILGADEPQLRQSWPYVSDIEPHAPRNWPKLG